MNSGASATKAPLAVWKVLIALSILAAVTIISFYPTLSCGFTNWDDDKYVTDNLMIRELSWNGIIKLFTTFQYHWYHPFVGLSYSVEYHFFGLNPRAYHTTNLVLHLLNVFCVYWFILLITGDHLISFVTSILFSVHPLRVESVAWITERKDLLFSLFFLLSSVAYIYYLKGGKWLFYCLSILSFIVSLLSKQMAVTLPLTLLLIDFFFRRLNWKALANKMPYFIASGAIVFIILFGSRNLSLSAHQFPELCWYHNLFIASYVVMFYLYKSLLPFHLCAIYPFPDEMLKGMLPLLFWISPAGVAALAVLTWFIYRRSRTAAFGILFFVINLIPVMQLVSIITFAVVTDRFTYIPCIGLALVIALVFCRLLSSSPPSVYPAFRFAAVLLMAALVLVLSYLTFSRCGVWRDSITLWSDVQRQYPDFWVSYTNRGAAYGEANDYDKAFRDLNRAIELCPAADGPYINRGLVFRNTGNPDRAMEDFNTALRISPDNTRALLNRGICFAMKKEYDKALADFSAVPAADPAFEEACLNRDKALDEKSAMNREIEALARQEEKEPGRADIRVDRGLLLYQRGDLEGALNEYSEAIRLDPSFAVAYNNRALVYKAMGSWQKAVSDYSLLYRLNPAFPDVLKNRGSLYAMAGDYERAVADFSLSIEKSGGDPELYLNRGTAYAQTGRYDRAIEDFSGALKINPRYVEAYYRRAALYRLKRDHGKADLDIEKINELDNTFNRKKLDDLVTLFAG